MSSKPTHSAYVVIDPKEGSDRKAQWHEMRALKQVQEHRPELFHGPKGGWA
jgi:hypothetical protein